MTQNKKPSKKAPAKKKTATKTKVDAKSALKPEAKVAKPTESTSPFVTPKSFGDSFGTQISAQTKSYAKLEPTKKKNWFKRLLGH